MAEVSASGEQDALEVDLRTNWRWLSIMAIERESGGLIITVRDDQQHSDRFHLAWGRVHAYAVRDESFTNLDEGGLGGPFKELTGSHFLAWVAEATWTRDEQPLRHWQIAGSDEVVDVASLDPPTIRQCV